MKFKRIKAGLYQSIDGRIEIRRSVSQQTRRADETCWIVKIDGKVEAFAPETLTWAKQYAARLFKEKT